MFTFKTIIISCETNICCCIDISFYCISILCFIPFLCITKSWDECNNIIWHLSFKVKSSKAWPPFPLLLCYLWWNWVASRIIQNLIAASNLFSCLLLNFWSWYLMVSFAFNECCTWGHLLLLQPSKSKNILVIFSIRVGFKSSVSYVEHVVGSSNPWATSTVSADMVLPSTDTIAASCISTFDIFVPSTIWIIEK